MRENRIVVRGREFTLPAATGRARLVAPSLALTLCCKPRGAKLGWPSISAMDLRGWSCSSMPWANARRGSLAEGGQVPEAARTVRHAIGQVDVGSA